MEYVYNLFSIIKCHFLPLQSHRIQTSRPFLLCPMSPTLFPPSHTFSGCNKHKTKCFGKQFTTSKCFNRTLIFKVILINFELLLEKNITYMCVILYTPYIYGNYILYTLYIYMNYIIYIIHIIHIYYSYTYAHM